MSKRKDEVACDDADVFRDQDGNIVPDEDVIYRSDGKRNHPSDK